MEIYERIKARRKEIGMSAETVAEKLGVSPATIYRYENNDIKKFPTDILAPLAEVLRTTPAYLLGVENKSSESAEPPFALSEKEKTVVLAYRAHPDMQNAVDRLLGCTDDSEAGDPDDTVQVYMAARSKNGAYEPAGYRSISKELLEKLQNAPEVKDGEI